MNKPLLYALLGHIFVYCLAMCLPTFACAGDGVERLPKWDISKRANDRYADLGDFPRELLLTPAEIRSRIPRGLLFHTIRSIEWARENLAYGFRPSFIDDPRTTPPVDKGYGLYASPHMEHAVPLREDMFQPSGLTTSFVTLPMAVNNIDLLNVVNFEKLENHPRFKEQAKSRAQAMKDIASRYHIDTFFYVYIAYLPQFIIQNELMLEKPKSLLEVVDVQKRYAKTEGVSTRDQLIITLQALTIQSSLGESVSEEFGALEAQQKEAVLSGEDRSPENYILVSFIKSRILKQSPDDVFLVKMLSVNERAAFAAAHELEQKDVVLSDPAMDLMVKSMRANEFQALRVGEVLSVISARDPIRFYNRLIERARVDLQFREILPKLLNNLRYRNRIEESKEGELLNALLAYYQAEGSITQRIVLDCMATISIKKMESQIFSISQESLLSSDPDVVKSATALLRAYAWIFFGDNIENLSELRSLIPKVNWRHRAPLISIYTEWNKDHEENRRLQQSAKYFKIAGTLVEACIYLLRPVVNAANKTLTNVPAQPTSP